MKSAIVTTAMNELCISHILSAQRTTSLIEAIIFNDFIIKRYITIYFRSIFLCSLVFLSFLWSIQHSLPSALSIKRNYNFIILAIAPSEGERNNGVHCLRPNCRAADAPNPESEAGILAKYPNGFTELITHVPHGGVIFIGFLFKLYVRLERAAANSSRQSRIQLSETDSSETKAINCGIGLCVGVQVPKRARPISDPRQPVSGLVAVLGTWPAPGFFAVFFGSVLEPEPNAPDGGIEINYTMNEQSNQDNNEKMSRAEPASTLRRTVWRCDGSLHSCLLNELIAFG